MTDVASGGGAITDDDQSSNGNARISEWKGAGLLVLSVALLGAGIAIYDACAPNVDLVHLQWAGSATIANTIVHPMAYGSTVWPSTTISQH